MLCRKPYTTAGGEAYGCGQCLPCRFNRRRFWQSRIMLEAEQYKDNNFVSLTYSDKNMPEDGSLKPDHARDWLKRIREHMSRKFDRKIRFFLVGEYGDESWRPHYHAALFNYPACEFGQSRYSRRIVDCCYWCDLVRDTWKGGHVYCGRVERDSAGYLAQYVTKKMTDASDIRLAGRYPEFSRKSLKPGIGRDAMFEVADVMLRYGLDVTQLDVPDHLLRGLSRILLDRYLKQSLRRFIGRSHESPVELLQAFQAEVRALQVRAKADKDNPSLRGQILEFNRPKFDRFEARRKLNKGRKSL